MSHIPAAKMPHAHAHNDRIDGEPAQPDQAQPAPEPTTAVPPASASGAFPTSGGELPGGASDAKGGNAGRAEAPSSAGAGSTGGSEARSGPVNGPSARDEDDRSPFAIAAMVIGGLAVVGGIVAALTPFLVARDEPKSKKRKKRKSA